MKSLTNAEANQYLASIGMRLGKWNGLEDTYEKDKSSWINHAAPKEARRLYSFAQYVAGWLPRGNWKIFQIDNSGGLNPEEAYLFNRLVFGTQTVGFQTPQTLFFEFGKGKAEDDATELLLANLIHVFLLFESHGYLVSSNSTQGQSLSMQDGFIYFSSREKEISGATQLLKDFNTQPSHSPAWVVEIIAESQ